MKMLTWLWLSSSGYRLGILCRGLIGMLSVGISLLFIWVCKCLIDAAIHPSGIVLETGVAWMVGCLLARLLLSAFGSRYGTSMEIRLRNDLRQRLFDRLMKGCWTGREAFHTGDLLNRLEEDVRTVTDLLCGSIPSVMVTVSQLCGALYFLYQLEARLAGIVLCVMPVALLMSKRYVRRMHHLTRGIRNTESQMESRLQESLQHRILLRSLEYTSQTLRAFVGLQKGLQRQVMRRTDFSLFSRILVQAGFSAGYAIAFLWGIFGLREGSVTFGTMAAFLQLVAQVQNPMVELSRRIPAFVRALTSVERLSELSVLPMEEEGKACKLAGALGIRLDNVTYSYPGSARKVLDGFAHDFAPGSLTAIVGETGAGKSTLFRLILALLRPENGKMVLYNAMKEVEISSATRCNLSYVPQGNTLMSGSIRENLLMGNPAATEDELRFALHTAVADFVYSLPQGLDTYCGERGTGLSEGQAQRIAIARALLRPGRVLLLDEPTSSLDSETEQLLIERLAHQVEGRTLLIVTHREEIAHLCGSIVRLCREGI